MTPESRVLDLITEINKVLRSDTHIAANEGTLLRKARNILTDEYLNGTSQRACSSLAFSIIHNFLEKLG